MSKPWKALARPWVADIGSGDNPFPLANILVDLYPDDNAHRLANLMTDGRCFVRADVCDLPFDHKELDFVWCSSLLEHLDEPKKGFAELARVAKAGMLLVPSVYAQAFAQYTDAKRYHGHKMLCWIERRIDTRCLTFRRCDTQDPTGTRRALEEMGVGPQAARYGYGTEVRMAWGCGSYGDIADG